MARMKGNIATEGISGRVGQLLFKQYGDKTVVSRVPDMSRRKLTEKQREANLQFRFANRWANYILKDPEKYEYYRSIATGGKNARNMAVSEYMRMRKAGEDPYMMKK
jgi:hypothetical protein